MSTPVVKNVSKVFREHEGYQSFGEWYDTEQNIYIGAKASKYARREVPNSKWVNPFNIWEWDGASLEDILEHYENYVRNNPFLMSSLHELEDKQLGCWCKPNSCHGDVLLNLYNEVCEKTAPVKQKTEKTAPAKQKTT